jgi:hypothetical protein
MRVSMVILSDNCPVVRLAEGKLSHLRLQKTPASRKPPPAEKEKMFLTLEFDRRRG